MPVPTYKEENATYPRYYPNQRLTVYAPDWYHRGNLQHRHTSEIISSKSMYASISQNTSKYFTPLMLNTIHDLKRNGILGRIDLVTIIPKSKGRGYSPALEAVGGDVATYLKAPYERILISQITSEQKGCDSAEKRYNNVKNSISLVRPLKYTEKEILILDDVKVTGMTILETEKIMRKAGANRILPVCLAIQRNLDYFNKKEALKWKS